MISIRRYLQNDQKTDDTPLQLVQLLIEGIECHSVEGAPGALARLAESTQPVLAALKGQPPAAELLECGAQAVAALKQHNLDAVEYLRSPVVELQAKVRLLTDAVTAIASNSSENIRRLQQIKSQLLSTLEMREIRSLGSRLSQCMDEVLAEAERQRGEIDRAAEQLNRPSRQLSPVGAVSEAPSNDEATGLPSRAQAEEAIAQCCQDEAAAFVVMMVINQVQTLSQNLGDRFGDMVLQRFSAFVREQLPTVDQLFRWSGPTVVALVRRRSAVEVRKAIEPLLLQRLTVKTLNPEMQVPVSARWIVLPLMASPRVLFHKMDSFAGIEHEMT